MPIGTNFGSSAVAKFFFYLCQPRKAFDANSFKTTRFSARLPDTGSEEINPERLQTLGRSK